MSDLETTAPAALEQVRPLRERLDDIDHECETAAAHVAALRERLTADRTALHDAVEALAHTVEDASQRLADGSNAAEAALAAIANASHETGATGAQTLQTQSTALAGAAGELSGLAPQVTALAEAAAVASQAALDGIERITSGLAQAIDAAEQLLSIDLASLYADSRRALEAASTELLAVLHDRCPALLAEKEQDWHGKLDEVHGMVVETFTLMETHAGDVAEYTEQATRQLGEEQLDHAAQEAEALRGGLDALAHALADDKGRLQVASEMVVESLQTTSQAAKVAEQKLHEVRGRWGLEGFPC